MRFLSLCSGIEAASVAWSGLGWEPAAYSEIEPFPCAVLEQRHAGVPNLGDMTLHREWSDVGAVDLVVGGTPCQSFSIAGLRKGMDDPRGNLALVYLAILDRLAPRWALWENVPGVLSSSGGRDFGSFLGGLAQLGYGWAYRVLDAQYHGVPQRRRRVFVVGYLGDWRRAAAVLFERESLRWDLAPRREAGERVARPIRAQSQSSHREDTDNFVTHSLRGEGFDASEDGAWRGTPLITAFNHQSGGDMRGIYPRETAQLQRCQTSAIFGIETGNQGAGGNRGYRLPNEPNQTLQASGNCGGVCAGSLVRRLTPRECERLQGFPDDYTRIEWRGRSADDCPDGPRYKALGNSMAVPVMRLIGERIAMVERLAQARACCGVSDVTE